jgi:K+-transporting ATPase A subunit
MILGMSVETFTALHVVISLVAIAAGLVVAFGMLTNRRLDGWTALFLATTIATSVTGFFFHSKAFGPPHVVGVISLVVLAVALLALYGRHLAGFWRPTYVVTAILALYLNCFVAVVQAFQKVAFLHPLAPNGSEPPFLVAQGATLLIFLILGALGVRLFHPATPATLQPA